MQDKLPETPPVFQRGVEPMRTHVVLAFAVGMPHAVARHTVRLPDAFLQIRRERHAGGALKHIA